MKKYKNIMRTIAIVIVVCAIPAGCGIFLFSHITNVTTSATIGEIGTIILSLISVVITILLGYFVYMQSERIHALEETQYDVFLGVEKIDTSISFPSEMLLLCKSTSSDIRLFEGIVCNDLSLYAHTTLIKGCSSATVLPLVITTRNTPLITALCLKEINLSVDYFDCVQDKTSNRKEVFSITPPPTLYRFLSDQSHIILGLCIHGVSKSEITSLKAEITMDVSDQIGRCIAKKIKFSVTRIDEELRLTSSESE